MFVCLLHTEEDVPEDQRPFVKKAAGAAKFPAFTTTTTMVSSRAFQKEKAEPQQPLAHMEQHKATTVRGSTQNLVVVVIIMIVSGMHGHF